MNLAKLVTALLLASPVVARADNLDDLVISASFGGGLAGFVDSGTRSYATDGGAWEARVGFGLGVVELETAYLGTLQSIDALGLDASAQLLGTGFEADLRVNVLETALQPYGIFGVGWMRYDLANADVNTSDVARSDNIATLPVGIGLAFRQEGLVLDVRATYRLATGSDLLATSPTEEHGLHTWSTMFRVGFDLR